MKRITYCIIMLFSWLTLFSAGELTAQSVESGSFYGFLFGNEPNCEYDNWITHVSEGIANPGFNFYAPWDRQINGFGDFTTPDSLQLRNWNTISQAFCAQRWQSVIDSIQQGDFPYDLIHFVDADQNRNYYMLREHLNRAYDDNGTETAEDDEIGSFDLGWGLYVFNPQATNHIIITVPHPNDDFISVALAWKAFTTLNARYLMINGAGREVAYSGNWYYSNNLSISDPSRNASHPFNLTYQAAANDIRAILSVENSCLGREFSLQVHSYDSAGSPGRANCQVSSGNGQDCINLPTRDLSMTATDMINAAGYIIHPAGHLGNAQPVYTNNFWTVFNRYYTVPFHDGIHNLNIGNAVNLPGYEFNCQMLYTLDGWSNFDVYDPFFHIEMDELPNCYTQNDSTMAWFYGYEPLTHHWNPDTRYQRVIAYYTPWITALQAVLPTVFAMDDGHPATVPHISNLTAPSASVVNIYAGRAYEYDFKSWHVSAVQMLYQEGGAFQIVDTLYFNSTFNSNWVNQAMTLFQINGLEGGYTYGIRLGCTDKSNRFSGWSEPWDITVYADDFFVTDLVYDPVMTDDENLTIRWTGVGNVPFENYLLYRRRAGQDDWNLIAQLDMTASTFTDNDFGETDSGVFEYYLEVIGEDGQVFPSNTCEGWLRCYPASQIYMFEWVTPNQLHLQWLPVDTALSGMPDIPDYYKLSVADNPDFNNAVEYIVIPESDEPGFDLIIPPEEEIPPRLFFRVTALAYEVGI